jgi:hypothetical protein
MSWRRQRTPHPYLAKRQTTTAAAQSTARCAACRSSAPCHAHPPDAFGQRTDMEGSEVVRRIEEEEEDEEDEDKDEANGDEDEDTSAGGGGGLGE